MLEIQKYNLPDFDIIDSQSKVAVCVWQPDKTYLVLGQSNKAETSLDVKAVLEDHITVMKRPSGGETVILTPNTVVIAVSFATETLKNPKEYFRKINQQIIEVLFLQGISNLHQKGISDIAIGEKKILGSSIYRKPNRVFYHAVLNVAEENSIIEKYILHPSKEPDYRKGRLHSEFVTSLKTEGYDVKAKSLLYDLEKKLKTILSEVL